MRQTTFSQQCQLWVHCNVIIFLEQKAVGEKMCWHTQIIATQLHVLKHILCHQDCCCWVTESCDSLWHHGLQHTRLPCPSRSPRVYPNSCPLNSTEQPTHWKRPWCGARLKAKGEERSRGWDGWMASPTQWTWVWVSSRSWWWTGKPGVLQSMVSQRVRQLSDWTEPTLS